MCLLQYIKYIYAVHYICITFSVNYQAPKFFNTLDCDIRDTPSVSLFQIKLKTIYYHHNCMFMYYNMIFGGQCHFFADIFL